MPVDTTNAHKHPVVLFWHMHQPDYRNGSGVYQHPWTYLHGIKDYTDMAAHLEMAHNVRAVVNFSPVLLDQLNDYIANINAYFAQQKVADPVRILRDPLLTALVTPDLNPATEYRLGLIESCLKIHPEHGIERYAAYSALAGMARDLLKRPHRLRYVRDAFIHDLLMWYHLGWMGEIIKQDDFRFYRFVEQGEDFQFNQRREMLAMVRDHLSGIVPRYRALADAGKIELSMTPYGHPIAPLLLDLLNGSQAIPDISLPASDHYPGGEERLAWHVETGLDTFKKNFARAPAGCWPAEGAIGEGSLQLFNRYKFRWIASGGTVLRQSLASSLHSVGKVNQDNLHYVYQFPGVDSACFFRNDELSDLIGFTYSSWHADDAVGDLVSRLENIAGHFEEDNQAFTVIALDGENAWEYYPNNGLYFLQGLYKRLGAHKRLQLATFSELLDRNLKPRNLTKIIAGSWVRGNLRTWIGEQDKNRAWDMLVEAKRCFDKAVKDGELSDEKLYAAQYKLAVCESSDWFWWFGDDNPMDAAYSFDRLFRLQLMALYELLEQPQPEYLSEPFIHFHATAELPVGGTMRKAE